MYYGHGPTDTVLLYSGEVREIRNIKVGDIVMGYNSKPLKVNSTFSGIGEMYTIKQKGAGAGADAHTYSVTPDTELILRSSFFSKLDWCTDKNEWRAVWVNGTQLNIRRFRVMGNSPTDKIVKQREALEFLNSKKIGPTCFPQIVEISAKDYLLLSPTVKNNLYGFSIVPKRSQLEQQLGKKQEGYKITVTKKSGAHSYYGFKCDGLKGNNRYLNRYFIPMSN